MGEEEQRESLRGRTIVKRTSRREDERPILKQLKQEFPDKVVTWRLSDDREEIIFTTHEPETYDK